MKVKQGTLTTLASGIAIGVLLQRHLVVAILLGVAAGWMLRDLYSAARWTAMAVSSAWARKHPERWMARRLLRGKVPY